MTAGDMNDRYWRAKRAAYRLAIDAQLAAPSYEAGLDAYERAFRTAMDEYEQRELDLQGLRRPKPASAPRSFSYCPECDTLIPNGSTRCVHCQGV